MTIVHTSDAFVGSGLRKALSFAGGAARGAFTLLGPVGLLLLVLVLRYTVFEYFHGGEQTLRDLWHAFL